MNTTETETALAQSANTPVTVITAKQAAELIGVHHTTLYEGARNGEIPCRRVGRRFVFVRETVLKWLAQDTTAAA